MKTFARVIAAVFMILGVIIIMTGIGIAVSGLFGPATPKPSSPSLIPDLSFLVLLARFVAGGALGFQGLMLSAIGEVLWLLAAISDQTQRTSDLMGIVARRLNQSSQ